jgi:hypothetical protein
VSPATGYRAVVALTRRRVPVSLHSRVERICEMHRWWLSAPSRPLLPTMRPLLRCPRSGSRRRSRWPVKDALCRPRRCPCRGPTGGSRLWTRQLSSHQCGCRPLRTSLWVPTSRTTQREVESRDTPRQATYVRQWRMSAGRGPLHPRACTGAGASTSDHPRRHRSSAPFGRTARSAQGPRGRGRAGRGCWGRRGRAGRWPPLRPLRCRTDAGCRARPRRRGRRRRGLGPDGRLGFRESCSGTR